MNKNELFFDSVAHKWDEMVNHNSIKIRTVLESLEIRGSDSILDIGTGTGVLIPYLLEILGEAGRITAIDVSAQMLEIAKSKYDNCRVSFMKLDFMEAELQEAFDIVLCYSCFPHLCDCRNAIRRMLKVLKKDGKLLIFHSESREKINKLHENMDSPVKRDNLPPAEELKRVIETERGKVIQLEDSEEKYVLIASL